MRKARWFWPVFATVLLADCSTKEWVETALAADPGPHPVLGDVFRVTLAYNPGAALNISLGPASRPILGAIALAALLILFRLYLKTPPGGAVRAVALGLLTGGALGNLLDRLRSSRGVVDFIDLGVGELRFWTFNLADVGVMSGVLLLAAVLWREDGRREAEPCDPA